MKIYGLEKSSFVDYDGYCAAVIFTAGCPFRCPYCHNSEVVVDEPQMTEEEVFSFLRKRKNVLDAVVVTGGEPTMQADIVPFLKKLREFDLKIKLDTNGYAPKVLERVLADNLVDYVAMDIKTSPRNYADAVGLKRYDPAPVFISADMLIESNVDYEFRTTLVAEYVDEFDIPVIAQRLRCAKRLFLQKYVDSYTCFEHNLHEVPREWAEEYAEILRETIEQVELRNYL